MKSTHNLNCGAPICVGDPLPDYKDTVPWYIGEEVCTRRPYTELQIKQLRLNEDFKTGRLKRLLDKPYTANELLASSL